jgi:hypothetical protein
MPASSSYNLSTASHGSLFSSPNDPQVMELALAMEISATNHHTLPFPSYWLLKHLILPMSDILHD